MTIATERLILRHWRTSDREPFARLNADPIVMKFMPGLLTRQQSDLLAERIERHFDRHGFGLYAVELRRTQEFAGFTGLSVPSFDAAFTPCVEIGWRFAAEHWGQGLATEAAHAVAEHGFAALALAEIVSFTTVDNVRSRRVMQKLGMTHNPEDDFEHPNVPPGPMRHHVLYRLRRDQLRPRTLLPTPAPETPE